MVNILQDWLWPFSCLVGKIGVYEFDVAKAQRGFARGATKSR